MYNIKLPRSTFESKHMDEHEDDLIRLGRIFGGTELVPTVKYIDLEFLTAAFSRTKLIQAVK